MRRFHIVTAAISHRNRRARPSSHARAPPPSPLFRPRVDVARSQSSQSVASIAPDRRSTRSTPIAIGAPIEAVTVIFKSHFPALFPPCPSVGTADDDASSTHIDARRRARRSTPSTHARADAGKLSPRASPARGVSARAHAANAAVIPRRRIRAPIGVDIHRADDGERADDGRVGVGGLGIDRRVFSRVR